MKQYIVDIKGVCILENEWDKTTIHIVRDKEWCELEFDKSDIVKTEEVEEEANEVDKNIKLNHELYLQNQKAHPDDTI